MGRLEQMLEKGHGTQNVLFPGTGAEARTRHVIKCARASAKALLRVTVNTVHSFLSYGLVLLC